MLNPNHIRLLFLALLLSISQEQSAHPAVAVVVVKAAATSAKAVIVAKGSFLAIIKAAAAKVGLASATKAVGGKAVAVVTTKALAATATTTTATAISAKATAAAVAAKTTTAVAIKTSSVVVLNASASAAVRAIETVAVTTSAFVEAANGVATTSKVGQSTVPPNQNDQQGLLTREQVKKTLEEKLDELWVILKDKGIPAIRSILLGKILNNTFDYLSGKTARLQKEKEKTEIYRNNIDVLNNEIKKLREEDAQKQQRAEELVIEIKKIHGLLISMKQG